MDLRNTTPETEIRETIERASMRINTAIPGIIESFDSLTQTVSVTPAIKMRVWIDNEESYVQYPKIINVPLVFPGVKTNGFFITMPVSPGDECLLIFSQRAIDNWHDKGDIQTPEEGVGSRHHDLTDAFAILAPVSLPNVVLNYNQNDLELRNRDGSVKITLSDGGITITGNLTVSGSIKSETSVEDPSGTMDEMRGIYNNHSDHPPGDMI